MKKIKLKESELIRLIENTVKEQDNGEMEYTENDAMSLESLHKKIDELTEKVEANASRNKDIQTVLEEFFDIWGLTGGGMR